MGKKSFQEKSKWIPLAFGGVQVNCCKFTKCRSFGVTPEDIHKLVDLNNHNQNTEDRQPVKPSDFYTISGTGNKSSSILCKGCVEFSQSSEYSNQKYYSLKSNKGIYEELERLSEYLVEPGTKCPKADCPSNIGDEAISIKKKGKTPKGNQRYICNVCKYSFTGKPIIRKHTNSEIDIFLFKQLVSKTPLRRIADLYDMSMGKLYRRIDFIHKQCLAFVGERERRLPKKQYERMYLCTDRQVHISNWTNRKEKQNCEFYAIGTADLTSSYVLAYNFNYDASIQPDEAERMAAEVDDISKLKHHREFARIWLRSDFEETKRAKGSKFAAKGGSLQEDLENQAAFNQQFDTEESAEMFNRTHQVPVQGVEIHNEYTMAAHFFLIKKLLMGVEKTRFFMDQDSGMRNWYIAAFKEEISENSSDGFTVTMKKEMTVDEKKKIARDRKKQIGIFAGRSYQTMSAVEVDEVIRRMIISSMENPTIPRNDYALWVFNPTPSMNEVDKYVAACTNLDRYDKEHQANLYKKASLHAIDRFFMQIRRKVSIFERPKKTGNRNAGTWYGYQPYNPELFVKLGDIFRVFYNYCLPDEKNKQTPAMKLGLAKGTVKVEKILYYDKYK